MRKVGVGFIRGPFLFLSEMKQGIYILCVEVKEDCRIAVGGLGTLYFKKGTYLYIGSGGRNLKARLERHMSDEKKVRWHIDYLLKNPHVNITRAYFRKGSRDDECVTARGLAESFEEVPGFGSSDCKCPSHLFYAEGDFSPVINRFGFSLYRDS
jgi:Uri superfamily endonuclease